MADMRDKGDDKSVKYRLTEKYLTLFNLDRKE